MKDEERHEESTPLSSHAGLIATGLVFSWVGVNVLAATRGDIVSAQALISTSGTVDVALGVLTSSVGWAMFVIFFALGYLRPRLVKDRPGEAFNLRFQLVSFAQAGVAIAGILFLPPFDTLLFAIPLAIAIWLMRHAGSRGERSAFIAVFMLVLGVILAAVMFLSGIWLPTETFTTTNGDTETAFIAYALDDTEGWTTYLDDKHRTVQRIRSNDVQDRYICTKSQTDFFGTPLIRFGRPIDLPPCASYITEQPSTPSDQTPIDP